VLLKNKQKIICKIYCGRKMFFIKAKIYESFKFSYHFSSS